jgi:hypothetical protein
MNRSKEKINLNNVTRGRTKKKFPQSKEKKTTTT